MNLQDAGEDQLIAALVRPFAFGRDVRVGIGDDCAVIGKPNEAEWMLLKTDCVVENVHFLSTAPPEKIGWKAMARPLSDIAAMSGLPKYALVTIALPATASVSKVKGIYRGIRRAAERFRVTLAGGETSRSPGPIFISVALTGTVERGRCVTRAGGRAGDQLYVTGRLGGLKKHLDFVPRIIESRWLTENFRVHAMMDLSDGLAADLPRLARSSKTGFALFEEKIPRNRGCSVTQALCDGEDYELLLAISPGDSARLDKKWARKFPHLPLTRIGNLTRPSTFAPRPFPDAFDHFKKRA